MTTQSEKQAIKTTIIKSVVLAVAMFAFAVWVMPPLYNLFCEVTGINGKTNGRYEAVETEVDTSRVVRVQFVGTNSENMPWEFKPMEFSVETHPGEAVTTHFYAKNPTGEIMVGQAVPSLVPHNAVDYFHKTECFCFNQQTLGPGESAELGLQFIVDQELPKGVNTITLSYTLFDVTKTSPDAVQSKQVELEQTQTENKPSTEFETQTLMAKK